MNMTTCILQRCAMARHLIRVCVCVWLHYKQQIWFPSFKKASVNIFEAFTFEQQLPSSFPKISLQMRDGRMTREATLSVLWLIGGIEASDGCNAIHANVSCSFAVVVVVVGGLVELGIFMSNGRADSENGIGESGKAKRRRGGGGGWKIMEAVRRTDLRYVPFTQRERGGGGRESRVNDL